MPRQRIIWFAIGLLILSSLACNAFAGAPEPALSLPPPPISETDMASAPIVAATLAATATPHGAATDVPLVDSEGNPLLEALVDVNIRTGPGIQYNRDGFLFTGETAQVVGRDPVSGWWKIACPNRSDGKECWISGGSQYTKVVNGEGVPVAAVPPTPTPKPTTAPIESPDGVNGLAVNGRLVYTDETGLWLVDLDMSENPPTAGEPVHLDDDINGAMPMIAPNGQKVAYMTGTSEANMLHMVNVDGSGHQILVSSAELPVIVETDTAVLIGQVQWLSDSQSLAFNTYIVNLIGPGVGEREDLWEVSLDGTVTQRFIAGQGGGTFDISISNHVIFGQTEGVVRANLDGSAGEEVIDFDFVNTASEYAYSAQPRWTADGSQANVAIPSADPWIPEASTTLWRIPATGGAEKLETLPGNVLFDPVTWSPDGSRLAYVMREIDASNPLPVLTLAEGDGRNPTPYASDEQLSFYSWGLDGNYFLYSGSGFYAVGEAGSLAVETAVSGATIDMQWLTPASFIAATGAGNVWNLYSNNLDGDSALLATVDDNIVQFDAWIP